MASRGCGGEDRRDTSTAKVREGSIGVHVLAATGSSVALEVVVESMNLPEQMPEWSVNIR